MKKLITIFLLLFTSSCFAQTSGGAGNDVGNMPGCGIVAVVDTDVIWFAVRNITGTSNIDIDEMSFVIHKL